MVQSTASEIGGIIGQSIKQSQDYKEDFFETESTSDILLTNIEAANLGSSTFICTAYPSNAFVLDHPVYGELDSSIYALDGGYGTRTCFFVDSYGSIEYYYSTEDFSTEVHKSTGTAYWDTVTPKLAMSSLATHFPKLTYHDVGTFSRFDSGTITSVKVSATQTLWNPTDSVTYYASADNKATWTQVNTSSYTTLGASGTTLYLRVTFTGQGNIDTYIQDLTVYYT